MNKSAVVSKFSVGNFWLSFEQVVGQFACLLFCSLGIYDSNCILEILLKFIMKYGMCLLFA